MKKLLTVKTESVFLNKYHKIMNPGREHCAVLGDFAGNADTASMPAVGTEAPQYFLLEQLSTFFELLGDN